MTFTTTPTSVFLCTAAAVVALGAPSSASHGKAKLTKAQEKILFAALKDYGRTIKAYNEGDAQGYYSGFADRLRCFYNARDYPLSRLIQSRAVGGGRKLDLIDMTLLHVDRRHVAFIEYGWWATSGEEPKAGTSVKYIALERHGSKWKIVSEYGRGSKVCDVSVFNHTSKPKKYKKCRRKFRKCKKQWARECARREERGGGGNYCATNMWLTDECLPILDRCGLLHGKGR